MSGFFAGIKKLRTLTARLSRDEANPRYHPTFCTEQTLTGLLTEATPSPLTSGFGSAARKGTSANPHRAAFSGRGLSVLRSRRLLSLVHACTYRKSIQRERASPLENSQRCVCFQYNKRNFVLQVFFAEKMGILPLGPYRAISFFPSKESLPNSMTN